MAPLRSEPHVLQRRNSEEGRKAGLAVGLTVGTLIILVVVFYLIRRIVASDPQDCHSRQRSKKAKEHSTKVNGHKHIHVYEPAPRYKSKKKERRQQYCHRHGKHPRRGHKCRSHPDGLAPADLFEWIPNPRAAVVADAPMQPDAAPAGADAQLPPLLPDVGPPLFGGPDCARPDPVVIGEARQRVRLPPFDYMRKKHSCRKRDGGCCDNCCGVKSPRFKRYRLDSCGGGVDGSMGGDNGYYYVQGPVAQPQDITPGV